LDNIENIRVQRDELSQLRRQSVVKTRYLAGLRSRLHSMKPTESPEHEIELIRNELEAEKSVVAREVTEVNDKINDLLKERIGSLEPAEAIQLFSDKTPILLFPVRLETKFKHVDSGNPQLWLRVFPDDIAIETHEPNLTFEEFEDGRRFFEELWKAEFHENKDDVEQFRKKAWSNLLKKISYLAGSK